MYTYTYINPSAEFRKSVPHTKSGPLGNPCSQSCIKTGRGDFKGQGSLTCLHVLKTSSQTQRTEFFRLFLKTIKHPEPHPDSIGPPFLCKHYLKSETCKEATFPSLPPLHRISVVLQKGNAAAVLGTIKDNHVISYSAQHIITLPSQCMYVYTPLTLHYRSLVGKMRNNAF